MLGRQSPEEIELPYGDFVKDDSKETVVGNDPERRRVMTDVGSHEADFLARYAEFGDGLVSKGEVNLLRGDSPRPGERSLARVRCGGGPVRHGAQSALVWARLNAGAARQDRSDAPRRHLGCKNSAVSQKWRW